MTISLRTSGDFASVLRMGKTSRCNCIKLSASERAQKTDPTRLGLAVRVAPGGAVERNRIKRRLRACCRHVLPSSGWDVVIRADEDALRRPFEGLSEDVARAAAASGLA